MLIVNPYSGRGISKTALGTIIMLLCRNGYSVTVCFTGENTIEQLVTERSGHHEIVVCIGGDGTLSSVVSALLRSGVSIPVGYIPAGTANDVAATLALSKEPNTATRTITDGRPRPIDVGLIAGDNRDSSDGDRFFTYIAAFGAFTGVSYKTTQSAKRALGHFAYILGGLADMAAIKPRHTIVEYDGGAIEGDFIFGGVVNSTSVAGFVKFDREIVNLADGLFEVILVKQPMNLADFLSIFTGIMTQNYDGDNVLMFQASSLKFAFDEPVPWTIDGEDGGRHREVEITNCNEAVRIIV